MGEGNDLGVRILIISGGFDGTDTLSQDTLSASTAVMVHFSAALDQYVSHEQTVHPQNNL